MSLVSSVMQARATQSTCFSTALLEISLRHRISEPMPRVIRIFVCRLLFAQGENREKVPQIWQRCGRCLYGLIASSTSGRLWWPSVRRCGTSTRAWRRIDNIYPPTNHCCTSISTHIVAQWRRLSTLAACLACRVETAAYQKKACSYPLLHISSTVTIVVLALYLFFADDLL